MRRDFIISSVYLAGDDVPDVDQVHSSVRETLDIGSKLLADHTRRGVVDLSRLVPGRTVVFMIERKARIRKDG